MNANVSIPCRSDLFQGLNPLLYRGSARFKLSGNCLVVGGDGKSGFNMLKLLKDRD